MRRTDVDIKYTEEKSPSFTPRHTAQNLTKKRTEYASLAARATVDISEKLSESTEIVNVLLDAFLIITEKNT